MEYRKSLQSKNPEIDHQDYSNYNQKLSISKSNYEDSSKQNNSIMSVNVQLILKQIFEFYCQFGERLNTIYLKSHKFFKFAQDANIYDSNLTKIKLELLYKAEIGNNQLMDFKSFLNSLIKIADAKYNSKKFNPNETSRSLINSGIFYFIFYLILL